MKIISLTCPKCGGNLEDIKFMNGRNDTYCQFCGNHIFLEDNNTHTFVHRTVDEVKMRELEYRIQREEEQRRKFEEFKAEELEKIIPRFKKSKDLMIIGIVGAFILVILSDIFEEVPFIYWLANGFAHVFSGIFTFSFFFWLYYRGKYNQYR